MELIVVIVIIMLLSSLMLAGLAGVRQRAKIDKTRSTIRKLSEIVVPHYESYIRRRVPLPSGLGSGAAVARERLKQQRCLMAAEMPDRWIDVDPSPAPPIITSAMRAYRAYKQQLIMNAATTTWATNALRYEGAECLAMIIMRGGIAGDAIEHFRSDEFGDIDRDGAVEFWDGWGRPIDFIRWPAGFESAIQTRNAAAKPDPFDPFRVSDARAYPYAAEADLPPTTLPAPTLPQRDYALVPLIYSAGPDEATNDPLGTASGYGLERQGPTNGWIAALTGTPPLLTTRVGAVLDVPGRVDDPVAVRDNITNHDLAK